MMKTYRSKTQFIYNCAVITFPILFAVTIFIYLSIRSKPELGEQVAKDVSFFYLLFCTFLYCIVTPVVAMILPRHNIAHKE